jgi:hypothetical protein
MLTPPLGDVGAFHALPPASEASGSSTSTLKWFPCTRPGGLLLPVPRRKLIDDELSLVGLSKRPARHGGVDRSGESPLTLANELLDLF